METLDEFELRMDEVSALAESGNSLGALKHLDEVWNEFAERDDEHWMERSILAQRAALLAAMGRHAEAIDQLNAAQSLQPDILEFVSNQHALARALTAQGHPAAAMRALETGLERATGDAEPFALRLLTAYAEIATGQGSTVPLHYGSKLVRAAALWGLDVPASAVKDEATFTLILSGIASRLGTAD